MLLGTFSGRSWRSVHYGEKKVRLKRKKISSDLTVKLSSGIIQKGKSKIRKVVFFFSECPAHCVAAGFAPWVTDHHEVLIVI